MHLAPRRHAKRHMWFYELVTGVWLQLRKVYIIIAEPSDIHFVTAERSKQVTLLQRQP